MQPGQAPQPGVQPNEYSFIVDPGKPPTRNLVPRNLPPVTRIIAILGGVLVLFIIFAIIKSVIGGSSGNTQALLSVAQDQQSIVHILSASS